jgi:HK97 family phage major capsid protein
MSAEKNISESMVAINGKSQAIVDKAAAEGREFTVAERIQLENNMAEFNRLDDKRLKGAVEAEAYLLSTPQRRMTSDGRGSTSTTYTPGAHTAHTTSTTPLVVGGRSSGTAAPSSGAWGFSSASDFFAAVRNQAGGGGIDPRLVRNAATTFGSEGVSADGGYALPPDFRPGVQTLLAGPDSLLARLDNVVTPNSTVTVPTDEDPPWSASGIAAATTAEGAAITQTKPLLKQVSVTLSKYAVLVPVSDEMLEDGTLIGPHVTRKSADKLLWKVNAAIFSAIGASAAKVTIPKTTGAAAGSAPDLANLGAIWKSMPSALRRTAIWLANPALEPAFSTLSVGSFPVYLPAGGLAESPNATLYGRPILYTELCPAVGSQGDITLVDPQSFYGVTKSGGTRVDISPHFYFDQDMTAFRAILRLGVACKFSAAITRPDSTTAAPVVQLAVR